MRLFAHIISNHVRIIHRTDMVIRTATQPIRRESKEHNAQYLINQSKAKLESISFSSSWSGNSGTAAAAAKTEE